jgi:hypothetical protein
MIRDRYRGALLGILLVTAVALPLVAGAWLSARHQEARGRLQQEIAGLQVEERSTGAAGRRDLAKERIDALQKQMEGRDRLAARIEQLHRIAGGYGVRIVKVGYQLHAADAASGGIGRYEIRLETEAAYYELRFFLRDLLAADPLLALESVDLRRGVAGSYNVGGKSILATLHIVMYFGSAQ